MDYILFEECAISGFFLNDTDKSQRTIIPSHSREKQKEKSNRTIYISFRVFYLYDVELNGLFSEGKMKAALKQQLNKVD